MKSKESLETSPLAVSTAGKPYGTLDAWRGIACLFVVLYHASATITGRFTELADFPLYRAAEFGYLGVPIFFVISGYCIASAACSTLVRKATWWDFMRARILRIYPACWVSLLMVALISALAEYLLKSGHLHSSTLANRDLLHKSTIYYFSNVTLMQPIFHQPYLSIVCWTLSYEVSFYFIVSLLLLRIVQITKKESLLGWLHTLTLASLLTLLLNPNLRFFPLDLWPQFGLGVLIFDILRHPTELRPKLWFSAVILILVAFIVVRHLEMGPQAEPSRLTFTMSLGFAVLLLFLHQYDRILDQNSTVRGLCTLGLWSYSIYLTHFFVIGLVNQSTRYLHITASLHLLFLALCFAASILFGRAFHLRFELPFMHFKPARKSIALPHIGERSQLTEDLVQ